MRTYFYPSKSSPFGPPHETTVHDDDRITCTCRGYRTPKGCWHVEDARSGPIGRRPEGELIRDTERLRLLSIIEDGDGDDIEAAKYIQTLFPSISYNEAVQFAQALWVESI